MNQDGKFEFESVQDCQTIQKYLDALKDGFGQGRIVLNSDGSEICLHPGGLMRFEVSVKRKGAENRLGIKVSWKDKREEPSAKGEISITT